MYAYDITSNRWTKQEVNRYYLQKVYQDFPSVDSIRQYMLAGRAGKKFGEGCKRPQPKTSESNPKQEQSFFDTERWKRIVAMALEMKEQDKQGKLDLETKQELEKLKNDQKFDEEIQEEINTTTVQDLSLKKGKDIKSIERDIDKFPTKATEETRKVPASNTEKERNESEVGSKVQERVYTLDFNQEDFVNFDYYMDWQEYGDIQGLSELGEMKMRYFNERYFGIKIQDNEEDKKQEPNQYETKPVNETKPASEYKEPEVRPSLKEKWSTMMSEPRKEQTSEVEQEEPVSTTIHQTEDEEIPEEYRNDSLLKSIREKMMISYYRIVALQTDDEETDYKNQPLIDEQIRLSQLYKLFDQRLTNLREKSKEDAKKSS
jgi:hypothetical protein